jgi:hypothetical protein
MRDAQAHIDGKMQTAQGGPGLQRAQGLGLDIGVRDSQGLLILQHADDRQDIFVIERHRVASRAGDALQGFHGRPIRELQLPQEHRLARFPSAHIERYPEASQLTLRDSVHWGYADNRPFVILRIAHTEKNGLGPATLSQTAPRRV